MKKVIDSLVKPRQAAAAALIVFSLAFWLVYNLNRNDASSDAPNTSTSSKQKNEEA